MFLDGVAPYALEPARRDGFMAGELARLLEHHARRCPPYASLVEDWRRHRRGEAISAEDYPFVPVSLFKEVELRSTDEPVLQVRSSSTMSAAPSRIFVDSDTRKRQTLSATRVWTDYLGSERRPYLVFDTEASARGSGALSARGAAILSLMHLASEFHFVCRESEAGIEVDPEALARALDAIGERPFFAYGFTYILYQSHLQLASRGGPLRPAHPDSVLLHSGGWKRLEKIAVDKPALGRTVASVWGLEPDRVIDFYGSVELVGIPFPDCPNGLKHVPYWSQVVVRRADDLTPCGVGEAGLLQLLSLLPLSAPNHSVLTEDLGELALLDGCDCGRRGRAFVFRGRAPRAELRGCSDVARP
jgi:hypothetical protein